MCKYTRYKVHKETCPDFTQQDRDWITAAWNDITFAPALRPNPPTEKCICGMRSVEAPTVTISRATLETLTRFASVPEPPPARYPEESSEDHEEWKANRAALIKAHAEAKKALGMSDSTKITVYVKTFDTLPAEPH